MTGTIFVATYTANLAAFLTITKSAIAIRTLEDLVNQDQFKYGTVLSSQPAQFFERSDIPLYQKMWAHMVSANTLVVSCVTRAILVLPFTSEKNISQFWCGISFSLSSRNGPLEAKF